MSDESKPEIGDVIPDAVSFVGRKGAGKMLRLLNGNTVELWQGEQDDDWLFLFWNERRDRKTLLRLSGEAAFCMAGLLIERVRDGSLPQPGISVLEVKGGPTP